jgi:zinc protease
MVVMEERRLRTEDNPFTILLEQFEATAFQIQPYHWPIIGWMEDLARLTLEDLNSYYRTYYNPVNAFIVAVGDFKKEDLLSQIEKTFGSYPRGIPPNQEGGRESPQIGERRIFVKKEAQLPSILMGYHVPNMKDPDGYVLDVTGMLLSAGKSSRLYQNLVRDKRLVLDADADYSLLSRSGPLTFRGSSRKEVAEVERLWIKR